MRGSESELEICAFRRYDEPSTLRFVLAEAILGWQCSGGLLSAHLGATQIASRTFTTADGLPRDEVGCVVPDSKGFVWLCTSEGVSRYDGYQFVNYGVAQGLPRRSVNAVLETRTGIYFFATDLGIARLDVSKAAQSRTQFIPIPRQDGMAVSRVSALFEDHAGTVWASSTNGVYRVENPAGARPMLRYIHFGDAVVTSLLEDRYGTLWAGTEFGLCRRWADGRIEWLNGEGSPMRRDWVHALMIDREGHLWAGSLHGLWKFEISGSAAPKLLRDRKSVV